MFKANADKLLSSPIHLVSFYPTYVPELGGEVYAQYTGDENEGILFVLAEKHHKDVHLGRTYYWVQLDEILDYKIGTRLKKYAVQVKIIAPMTDTFEVEFFKDINHPQKYCIAHTNPEKFGGINMEVWADMRARISPEYLVPGRWQVQMRSVISPVMDNYLRVTVEPLRRIASSPRAARRQVAHHGLVYGTGRPMLPESRYPRIAMRFPGI